MHIKLLNYISIALYQNNVVHVSVNKIKAFILYYWVLIGLNINMMIFYQKVDQFVKKCFFVLDDTTCDKKQTSCPSVIKVLFTVSPCHTMQEKIQRNILK